LCQNGENIAANEEACSGEAPFGNENDFRSSSSSDSDGPSVPIGRQLHNLTSSIEQLTSSVTNLDQDMNHLHNDISDISDLRNDFNHLTVDINDVNLDINHIKKLIVTCLISL
jgi:peptidoglycan hydrolase CwlO-like protein